MSVACIRWLLPGIGAVGTGQLPQLCQEMLTHISLFTCAKGLTDVLRAKYVLSPTQLASETNDRLPWEWSFIRTGLWLVWARMVDNNGSLLLPLAVGCFLVPVWPCQFVSSLCCLGTVILGMSKANPSGGCISKDLFGFTWIRWR